LFINGVTDLLVIMHGNLHKVDGLHERRCLKIQSSSNIKIEELIIVNGFASDFGGGVLAESSTLIMLRCVIMGSVANIGGGGLGLTAGSLLMNDCVVANNETEGGAGIGIGSGFVEMNRVAVVNNSALGSGGGVYVGYFDGAVIQLNECNITNNRVGSSRSGSASGGTCPCFAFLSGLRITPLFFLPRSIISGGMWIDKSQVNLTSCAVEDNSGRHSGGGLFAKNSAVSVVRSSIRGNYIVGEEDNPFQGYGGGVYIGDRTGSSASLTMTDTTVRQNKASFEGGGVYVVWHTTSASLEQTELIENSAESGGGLHADEGASVMVSKCLFSNNEATGFESWMGGGAVKLESQEGHSSFATF